MLSCKPDKARAVALQPQLSAALPGRSRLQLLVAIRRKVERLALVARAPLVGSRVVTQAALAAARQIAVRRIPAVPCWHPAARCLRLARLAAVTSLPLVARPAMGAPLVQV